MTTVPSLLILACGALAREIVALKRANGWRHVTVQCLPAELHNTPGKIPVAVRAKLERMQADYDQVLVAYADCGTGGRLDKVLEEYGVERLPGAHCYQFYAGAQRFERLAEAEPGSFYLTDFLVRHFERLVWQGLGLARHPALLAMYFGNYRKLVYLAQTADPALREQAEQAARRLGLEFEYCLTGYGRLETDLTTFVNSAGGQPAWQN